jgi:hypothetical protein
MEITRKKKNLLLFEAFVANGKIVLTSRQNRDIILTILGGRIDTIDNQSGVNFPYREGGAIYTLY